ncbi:MAG: DUF5916 domain-containing protein [Rhodothermales bacterium]
MRTLYRLTGVLCLVVCVGFVGAGRAVAQPAASYRAPETMAPVAKAMKAATLPAIDGNVLGDPAWRDAPQIAGFSQTTPDEGQPATEETIVRVVYTNDMLYVGVVCYDRSPDQIIVADSRRDAALDDMDSFRMVLDTYRDLQNGFIFGTNPAGVEYDAQVSNEGSGGGFAGGPRAQAGSGGGVNVNWDGSWTVQTEIGDYGWSAEFAIPFRTLRFTSGEAQVWGVNFQRTIRRMREKAFWAPLPRQFDLPRVSLAGTLEGLDIPDPRNLQITPYVLAQGGRDVPVDAFERVGPDADFGVDLKYSLTTSLTLDATYNTDFAQVEADEQQINLDRFNLFFPEKRPFFLENAGIFSAGQPGSVELFFSRRIGIGPNGEAVPIVGGARVSGDAAGMKIGFLNMQTAQIGEAGIPGNNFGVARVRRELRNRSFIGGLFTNRQGVGDFAGTDDYNRLVSIDGQLGIGRYGSVSGFLARSVTPGLSDDQYAFRIGTGYNSERWLLDAGYVEVAQNFNPEVGFLQRTAYRSGNVLIFHRYRPDFFGFHELRPHISYTGYWGFDDFYESGFMHIDNHWEWASGFEIHTGMNITHEGVREDFTILDDVVVPAGSYDHQEAMLVALTDQGKAVSGRMQAVIGGFFGGDRVALSPTLRLRSGDRFNSEWSLSRNIVDLPGGRFTTNLFRVRLSYSFTPSLYVQSLVQYNDAADLWSANFRFGWVQTAGTGLFIVFNQTNGFDRLLLPGVDSQTVVVKYSRLFNVLH